MLLVDGIFRDFLKGFEGRYVCWLKSVEDSAVVLLRPRQVLEMFSKQWTTRLILIK